MSGYQFTEKDFAAIRKVESGGDVNAVGDGGRSIGPYQIQRSYYNDAVQFNPDLGKRIKYEDLKGAGSIAKSEEIMQAYSNRYTTEGRLGRSPTFEDAARNHNGGPNGYKKDATKGYHEKVKHD